MKRTTFSLEDEIHAWARAEAKKCNMSLSQYLGNVLRERMRETLGYDAAMRRYFESTLTIRRKSGEMFAARDELYGRPRR